MEGRGIQPEALFWKAHSLGAVGSDLKGLQITLRKSTYCIYNTIDMFQRANPCQDLLEEYTTKKLINYALDYIFGGVS